MGKYEELKNLLKKNKVITSAAGAIVVPLIIGSFF